MRVYSATLAELVSDVAQRDGGKPALICADTPMSYVDLNTRIERAADGLAACGVSKGDRVALLMPNIPEFVVAYYAILRCGAIVVPINILYKEEEIAYVLQDSEAKAFILFADFALQGIAGAKEAPSVSNLIVVGDVAPIGTTSWKELTDVSAPERSPVKVTPDDVATICYTSGTTGRSKGAMLTHRNLIANCEQLDRTERGCAKKSDVLLLVLPLFHIYAMNCAMNSYLRAGATIVLIRRFDALQVLEQIQKHCCTFFHGAPPMYVTWVNTPTLGDYDLSSLRVAFSGAAPLPIQVLDRFQTVTGVEIVEGYGLTETSPVTHSNCAVPISKPGTIGPPIPGVEARLVDDEDCDVAPGTPGEIICRGENVTIGYWRNPTATAEALRNGWFHTGDIATIDEDGYYRIVDRKKDMINSGGLKVWPREVEEVLFNHPAVREAAVVAMPDAHWGERPMAYIALKEGQTAAPEELIAYCKQHVANYKSPCLIKLRDELPKLPTGKVLRRVLREEARQLTPASSPVGSLSE
ncbi:MAG: long-chain fatty acid--CoA ligase [Verrucomicrobia bacterium]|nr:long-chain fatty acid--CoA ligase [Verrucomicrobiota bacterium]